MKRFITLAVAVITVFAASRAFAQNDALPGDVSPDSRNRLPLLRPENAPEQAKRTYDNAMANFAGVPPKGPSMRLHASPVINLQMQSPLGLDLSQVAILITGREHDQPYEWSLHELQALSVSLDPTVIDVIRRKQPASKLRPKEAIIIELGREIFRTHKLDSGTYARALSILGQTNLVDVGRVDVRLCGCLRDTDRLQSANASRVQAVSPLAFHATRRHPPGLKKSVGAASASPLQPNCAVHPPDGA